MVEKERLCRKANEYRKEWKEMTREEIKNMDFEAFREQLPSMTNVKYLEADGTEVYGIYRHDVCYVERDGIQRTLQMIVPEMKPDKKYMS